MTAATIPQIKLALAKSFGIPAHAAKELGLTRAAVHDRIRRSPELQRYQAELDATLIDAAQGVITEAIVKNKDVNTARWLLERKGGYSTKVEASGPDGGAIPLALQVVVKYVTAAADPGDVV